MGVKLVYTKRYGGSLILVLGGIKEMGFYGLEEDMAFTMEVVEKDEDGKAKVISLVRAGRVIRK